MLTLFQSKFIQLRPDILLISYTALPGCENQPVRVFDGHRLYNADPLGIGLLEFCARARRYGEVESEYARLRALEPERPYFDLTTFLKALLQHRGVELVDEPGEPRALRRFQPEGFDDGLFTALDMMTLIDEGEHFPVTPYVIHNPRAGKSYYVDRPEYELIKYLMTPRIHAAIRDYYESNVKAFEKNGQPQDPGEAYLKPMLLENMIVFLPADWKPSERRATVFARPAPIRDCRIVPRGFPQHLTLIPTGRCNNRCLHCSAFEREERPHEDGMGFDLICRLLDEAHYNGVKTLQITGGEPLVRKDIFDIMEYAARRYFGLMLYTNGNLISERNIERLAAISRSKEGNFMVHLSLDGDQESHDWFRRTPGAYDRVIQAMRLFQQYAIEYYIEMTAHPKMMPGFRDTAERLRDLAARALLIHPALAIGRGMRHTDQIQMNLDQVRLLGRMVKELQEAHPGWDVRYNHYELADDVIWENARPSCDEGECHGEGDEGSSSSARPDPRPTNDQCTAGKRQMTVNYDGNVYPCPSWATSGVEPMGSVLTDSLANIWRYEGKWGIVRGAWDYADIALCKDCRHLKKCSLGKLCRIPSLEWFGTYYGPPPSCVRHYRELGLERADVERFLGSLPDASSRTEWSADFLGVHPMQEA